MGIAFLAVMVCLIVWDVASPASDSRSRLAVLAVLIAAIVIRDLIEGINRRDDPRQTKPPHDAP